MSISNDTIKAFYQKALVDVFASGEPALDKDFIKAIENDVYCASLR